MKEHLAKFTRSLCAAAMAITVLVAAAPQRASAAAPETAVPESTAAYSCFYYRVVWGDTLGRLAIRYGTTVSAIMSANGLFNTVIYAGRTLCIPQTVYVPPSGGAWLAQFWNNTTQSGTPVYSRYDSTLNFQWGYGTPNPITVFSDNFSARWTRTYNFIGGVYRFTLNADDGVRLWVDGVSVFDRLGYEGYQSNVFDVPIGPGLHEIRVDFVELGGLAKVYASFYRVAGGAPPPPPPVPAVGWTAEFFNNTTLAGSPALVVATGPIDFNWGAGSIAPSVQVDNFTARFTSAPAFTGGTYRFYAQVDDGVRVWLDGTLILNEWREQSLRGYYVDLPVAAGPHTVKVEYLELTGVSALKVYWVRLY